MGKNSLLQALSNLKVQTGSLACLGCGYEHQCSTKGCAIIRRATEELARYRQIEKARQLLKKMDDEMLEAMEILDNYYAKMAIKFIEQKKDALQDLDGWCESYQQDHDLEYTPAEVTAWKDGMRFGDDNAHDYLSDLIESDPTSMWDHER